MGLKTAFLITAISVGITDLGYYAMGIPVPVGIIGHVLTVSLGTYILSRLPK